MSKSGAIKGRFQPSISIDTSELIVFAQILKRADPIMYKHLHTRLKAAGKVVADEAKKNASWSTRIPPAVKVQASMGSVAISVSGKRAPGARPLEHEGKPGKFRHPVFGNREVWVSQPARPFITPALAAKREEVLANIVAALNETLQEIADMK